MGAPRAVGSDQNWAFLFAVLFERSFPCNLHFFCALFNAIKFFYTENEKVSV